MIVAVMENMEEVKTAATVEATAVAAPMAMEALRARCSRSAWAATRLPFWSLWVR